MPKKHTHINEQLFGPYLYHGSTARVNVGDSIVPQKGKDEVVHATNDILYASQFGTNIHMVVPHDWSEIDPWTMEHTYEDNTRTTNFDSAKGFKVVGHTEPRAAKEFDTSQGFRHPKNTK